MLRPPSASRQALERVELINSAPSHPDVGQAGTIPPHGRQGASDEGSPETVEHLQELLPGSGSNYATPAEREDAVPSTRTRASSPIPPT